MVSLHFWVTRTRTCQSEMESRNYNNRICITTFHLKGALFWTALKYKSQNGVVSDHEKEAGSRK